MLSATSCNGHKLEQRSCSLVKSMSHYWLYIPVAHPHLHVLPKYYPAGWGTGGGQERNLGLGVSTTVVFGGMGRWRGTRQHGYTQPRSMRRRDSRWTQKGEERKNPRFHFHWRVQCSTFHVKHACVCVTESECVGETSMSVWQRGPDPVDYILMIVGYVSAYLLFFSGNKMDVSANKVPPKFDDHHFPSFVT
jgi:hypothetical protein